MIYKVGICGATGRMGQEISALLAAGFNIEADVLEFSDAVARSHSISTIDGIPVRTLQEPPREPVHVWIDFSRPEATLNLLEATNEAMVIGTTGFNERELKIIQKYALTRPILLTANTSPGMNMLLTMLNHSSLAAKYQYDILASEIHHKNKKDDPSGTLKTILKVLEAKGNNNIQVQSARVGDEKGTHTVSFFSDDEELTLIHRVNNRRVFAKGALIAARYIAQQSKPGLYSFQDVEVR
ncbi:MAG: hypothetical protein EBQ85_01450 [Proteobacteria bacterium]|nr:hypothetical protein [Pseudomonadota bacterium]